MNNVRRNLLGVLFATAFSTLSGFAPAARATGLEDKPAVQPCGDDAAFIAFIMQPAEDPAQLQGKRIAVLATTQADAVTTELARDFLMDRGARIDVFTPDASLNDRSETPTPIAPNLHLLTTFDHAGERRLIATVALSRASVLDYDALYLPGTVWRAGIGSADPQLESFVRSAVAAGRPVFAVGSAIMILVQSGVLAGHRAARSPALDLNLTAPDAELVDQAMVYSAGVYTSRDVYDLPVLMKTMTGVLLSAILPETRQRALRTQTSSECRGSTRTNCGSRFAAGRPPP